MGADQAIGLVNKMLFVAMAVASPVLLVTLITGLTVSILQATTQIQEMTLGYVPKLFAAALVIIAFGSWMIGRITQFAIDVIAIIPALG